MAVKIVELCQEDALGTHCRKNLCDGLKEPNFMGRFSPILETGFGSLEEIWGLKWALQENVPK